MNRYVRIGIFAIAIGTLIMSQLLGSSSLFIFIGGIINGVGLYLVVKGSMISATKDKEDIIDKVTSFREEIGIIKNEITSKESLEKIDKIENEFNKWAVSIINNIESKKIEQQKSEITLKEKEISLSNKWRHIYQYVLETIEKIIEAYNQKANKNINYNIPKMPYNLFDEEAKLYKGMIIFNENVIWTITLSVEKPYKEDMVPTIYINYFFGERYGLSAREQAEKVANTFLYLYLSINIDNETIIPNIRSTDQYFVDLKKIYPISLDSYKSSIKEILTTLFEYQIVKLSD